MWNDPIAIFHSDHSRTIQAVKEVKVIWWCKKKKENGSSFGYGQIRLSSIKASNFSFLNHLCWRCPSAKFRCGYETMLEGDICYS